MRAQLSRSRLRRQVFATLLAAAAISILLFVFVWIPRTTNLWVEIHTREIDRQLSVIADSVTPFLLSNQFASLHETFDALLNSYDNWLQITLVSPDGRNLYPFVKPTVESGPNIRNLSQPIVIQGQTLGVLSATVDLSKDLARLKEESRVLGLAVTVLFLATMLVVGAIIELLVIRRLRLLAVASKEISVGNYAAKLPPESNDEFGALSRVFALMRESIRKNEADLTKARLTAEQAGNAKAQFLASMSHEIRTPLNGVIPVTEMLAATELDAKQRRLVNTIQSSGKALHAIIEDILDFSRLEAGVANIRAEPYNLVDLIEEVCEILGPQSLSRGVTIQSYISSDLWQTMQGDESRMRQILINLAGNAVKFTEHGSVTVRAEQVKSATGQPEIRIMITDTGIGIPEDQKHRIFDRFSQVDGPFTRQYAGSGLGLSISRMLVNAMGGQIGVDSVLGRGSSFWFTIPLKSGATALCDRPDAGHEPMRVSVLDYCRSQPDSVLFQETLCTFSHHSKSYYSIPDLAQKNTEADDPVDVILLNVPHQETKILQVWIEELGKWGVSGPRKVITCTPADFDAVSAMVDERSTVLQKPVTSGALIEAVQGSGPALDAKEVPRGVGTDAGTTGAAPRTLRVLLADDNEINRDIGGAMVTDLGHVVVAVQDGVQALQAVKNGAFDLVLMDVQMPKLDGLEATKAIRALKGAVANVSICGLSASATSEDAALCLGAGMDSFIPKPLNRKKMADLIEGLF